MNNTVVAGEEGIVHIQARDVALPEVKVLVYDGVSASVEDMNAALEDVGIHPVTIELDVVDDMSYFVVAFR